WESALVGWEMRYTANRTIASLTCVHYRSLQCQPRYFPCSLHVANSHPLCCVVRLFKKKIVRYK
ncbi:hypothetical protein L9F63_027548, partial [Diploptera punctata]